MLSTDQNKFVQFKVEGAPSKRRSKMKMAVAFLGAMALLYLVFSSSQMYEKTDDEEQSVTDLQSYPLVSYVNYNDLTTAPKKVDMSSAIVALGEDRGDNFEKQSGGAEVANEGV